MLTQDQYKLFTGETVNYSSSDWQTLVTVAELRLASFLCLDEFPELDTKNEDLAMLLANFIAGVLNFQGANDTIDSKSVRNFTIKFKTSSAANAFSLIAKNYGDIIDKYSECGLCVKAESSKGCGCYGYGI